MKIFAYTIVFCNLLFFPILVRAQSVNLLSVDGDTAVAYTGSSLALITDNGNTIKELNTPSILKTSITQLCMRGKTIIISGMYGYCHISTDFGTTWNDFELPEKSPFMHSIHLIDSKIYVGVNTNFIFSENNGKDWKKVSGVKNAHIISVVKNGNSLYAAGRNVDNYGPIVFVSTDGGAKWNKSIDGFNESGEPVFSIVANKTTVLASVSCSNDKFGVSAYDATEKKWSTLTKSEQFSSIKIHKVAISDTNYILSTIESGYFISLDKGITWKPIKTEYPEGAFNNGIHLISNNGVIYTVTNTGFLFISKDNGVTWTKAKFQSDAEKIVTDAALIEKNKNDVILAKQKAYRDSVAFVTEFRQKNDKTLKNYFKGIGEMSYSNYDSALVKFNNAILAKPDFTEAYEARAKCFKAMNQLENAKKDSITAGGLTPDVKANSLFANHFKSAEVEANTVGSVLYTECYYKDANGWYLRAKNHYSSEEQITLMWKAIELDTTKAEYYILLGDLSRDKYYDLAAEVHYKRAMKLNPNCQWYNFDRTRMLTCGNCNGKGYRLQVNITQQKVNNTTHSTSDSERKPCTECSSGYVKTVEKFPSVKLVK